MHCAFCAYLCAIRAALGVASFRSRRFSSSASRSSRQPLCQLHQIVTLGFSCFWLRMSTMKACQTSSLAIVSVLATLFINISQHRQEPEMCRHLPIGFPLLRCTFICSCTSRACCFNLVPTLKGILKWVLAFISVEFEWNYSTRPVPLFWNKFNLPVGKTTGEKTALQCCKRRTQHNITQHNTTIISAPVVGFWKVIKEVALLAPWRANFTSHGTPKVYICTRQTLKLRPGPTMYIVIQLMYIVFFFFFLENNLLSTYGTNYIHNIFLYPQVDSVPGSFWRQDQNPIAPLGFPRLTCQGKEPSGGIPRMHEELDDA